MNLTELWASNDPALWEKALASYEAFVKPANLDLERRLEDMGTERISNMSPEQWHAFLRNEYFVWKYTQPNRLITTRGQFDRWVEKNGLDALDKVRLHLLSLGPHIGLAIKCLTKIGGLGVAGASGLLSLVYPDKFGTVDQFVVKALQQVEALPEAEEIAAMASRMEGKKGLSLTEVDAVILTKILRRKAAELGHGWTPRKVDAVLWISRSEKENGAAPKFKWGDVCVYQGDEAYHIDGVDKRTCEYAAHRIKFTDHQFRGPDVVIPESALRLLTGAGVAHTIPMEVLTPILAREKEPD
jgi:hypothetical protein